LKFAEFILLFGLMTSLTALSIDAILPALRDIGQSLVVTDSRHTQLVISLLIFDMVFGELIFGPLSDAIGRRKAILIGIALYACGTLLALAAQSLGRIAGLGASLIASISSLVAVLVAVTAGRFYNVSVVPLALSFVAAAALALLLVLAAKYSTTGAIECA